MGFFRPTVAEINLGALIENYKTACSYLPRNAGIMAMVKADAYGHGAVMVSKKLEEAKVESLGVATLEEGLELRESGIKTPIVVIGGLLGMGGAASGTMVGADLTPVVHSAQIVEVLELAASAAGRTVGVHLKVDTGMSRLGVLPKDLPSVLNVIKNSPHIKLIGVMTHFAEAEDEEYTSHQMEIFSAAAKKVEEFFGKVPLWHMANSEALMGKHHVDFEKGSHLWARPGLMLYGAKPPALSAGNVRLKPVMTLKSKVALTKTVPAGTKVSYGCTFETERETRLAVVPIGYADGYPWSLSNKGEVLINGLRAKVAGRVTMDMIVVDVTDVDAKVGDEVVLMGEQNGSVITVNELAERAGTISYEIFCGISKRTPRVYV